MLLLWLLLNLLMRSGITLISSEYECCFKSKSAQPFINYCESNGFVKTKSCYQVREIFRGEGFIARITTDEINGKKSLTLDFKEDKRSGELVITRKESEALIITDKNAALSILEFLALKKDNEVKRNRIVYENDLIKFEIDDYFDGCYVIAIEGDSAKVDETYEKVKHLIDK